MTKTKVDTREYSIVIGLSVLLIGRMKTLGLLVRKAVKYFLWGLMGFTRSSIKDSDAENNVDYDSPAQEISRGTTIATGLETIFCDILARMWLLFSLLS